MMNLVIGLLFGIAAAAILVFMWRMVDSLRDPANDIDLREEIETTRDPSREP